MHLSKIKQNHINVKQTESVYKYKVDHNWSLFYANNKGSGNITPLEDWKS